MSFAAGMTAAFILFVSYIYFLQIETQKVQFVPKHLTERKKRTIFYTVFKYAQINYKCIIIVTDFVKNYLLQLISR